MKKLFVLLCLAFSTVAMAGTQTGTIGYIIVRADDGLIYFSVSGSRTGYPACATTTQWMIKDENSNAGKQQYAMLLAAKASGMPIHVVGRNTCTRWSDSEDVSYIMFVN